MWFFKDNRKLHVVNIYQKDLNCLLNGCNICGDKCILMSWTLWKNRFLVHKDYRPQTTPGRTGVQVWTALKKYEQVRKKTIIGHCLVHCKKKKIEVVMHNCKPG